MLPKRNYSKHYLEEKLRVVDLYKEGYGSLIISKKLSISITVVEHWLSIYNLYGLKGFETKLEIQITTEFREKVVRDVLDNQLSFNQASLRYLLSVSTIHSWVKKVKQSGYSSLEQINNRGRPRKIMGRPKKKLPETELEKLQEEIKYLRAENDYLKKLRVLVDQRIAREKGNKPKSSTH